MKFKTRTRKLAALLATLLVFSFIFAGCGKEEEKPVASVDSIETEEPEEEKEEEKYKRYGFDPWVGKIPGRSK